MLVALAIRDTPRAPSVVPGTPDNPARVVTVHGAGDALGFMLGESEGLGVGVRDVICVLEGVPRLG